MLPSKTTYIRLIMTMIFWGGTFVTGRWVSAEMHPLAAASGRFLLAATMLLMVTWLREKSLPRLDRRQMVAMALLGLTGVFAYNILFFTGLQTVEAGRGAMIIAANPVVTALLAIPLLGERFSLQRSIGIALALAGAITVISHGNPMKILQGNVGLGELCLVGCVLSWAAYSIIGKKQLLHISPLVAVTYSCVAGAIFLTIAALLAGHPPVVTGVSPRALASLVYMALFGTTIGFIWFYQGVHELGAGRASLFVNLVPVAGVSLGILLLGERPDSSLFIGGLLVFCGLYLVNRREPLKTTTS